jgi:electron transfer flavoprotein alpha/beta subunit
MRGIRAVSSVPIPIYGASDLGVDTLAVGANASKVNRLDYFTPTTGKRAQILAGSRAENAEKLLELMAAQGGLK